MILTECDNSEVVRNKRVL